MAKDRSTLADEAYLLALSLCETNRPNERLTPVMKDFIFAAILDLQESGMADRDLLASYAINRARRRNLG